MTTSQLRQAFLDFFRGKDHEIRDGISLVPTDPSVLLTIAGVVPFRAYIEGTAKPTSRRIASCQRCVRDKDTDQVGRTARHLTFFEMLGNFSFGDYYKREAIVWGWEFLHEKMKLSRERLWMTFFNEDEEAGDTIRQELGLSTDRIVPLGRKDNWWGPVGPTGGCGPTAEFFYDLGPEVGCGRPDCRPGCECDRYLEVWNLVFTEAYANADGTFSPLPTKNIDTGMGLERLAACVQGKQSAFQTDGFAPLVAKVEELSSRPPADLPQGEVQVLRRVIADHCRAFTMMIMDGMLPSNEGRGYVLRRFMRRSIVAGRRLGIDKTFLAEVPPLVAEALGAYYRELRSALPHIVRTASLEEERFRQVLDIGWRLLEEEMAQAKREGLAALPGEVAFRLHDTYGFPFHLTREIAESTGLGVEEEEFKRAMEEQRVRSRRVVEGMGESEKAFADFLQQHGRTEFLGYHTLEAQGQVIGLFREGQSLEAADSGDVDVILEQTPFYAEAGGQVGDSGTLESDSGRMKVVDTFQGAEELIVHRCQVVSGTIRINDTVTARVNGERRAAIRRAHTSTHLLHNALRSVLGTHVAQSGSLVEADFLRFDFSHYAAVTDEELREIEDQVNQRVLEDAPVETAILPLQEAKAAGAVALFGEKYGETVRLVQVGEFSKELCGGTHVSRSGQIGFFRIQSESSIGAGIRRITAVTGQRAIESVRETENLLSQVAAALGAASTKELIAKAESLAQELEKTREEAESLRGRRVGERAKSLAAKAEAVNGARIVVEVLEAGEKAVLADLCDEIASRAEASVVLLAAVDGGAIALACKVAQEVQEKGVSASEVVAEVARSVGGKGGGKPSFARGSGREPEKLPAALEKARQTLRERLRG